MRRLFAISLAAILLLTAFLTKAGVTPAHAAALSPGCAYINANGGTGTDLYMHVPGNLLYYAGETIHITDSGTSDDIAIQINFSNTTYAGNIYSQSVNWTIPTTFAWNLFVGALYVNGETISISCSPAPVPPGPISTDGRLNDDASQAGQTFAVYCNTDFSITVLAINPSTGNGFFAFTATRTDIAKVSSKPTVNTAIKSGQGATLYRLTSGQFQVNRNEPTGKLYSFVFNCGQ